jgi:phospholipid/cholesterol/gamma-HCH transport system substrate-binding protein
MSPLRRRSAPGPLLLAALLVGALLLTAGCGGADDLEVTAVFDDVADLVPRSAVTVADVQIGAVAEITRTPEQRALVRLRIDRDSDLPADVSARLRRTSLLGERFIELVPGDPSAPRLADGDRIARTEVVSDLEEVLLAGADIVAAVSADQLARGVHGAAAALGDRGETLQGLLGDMATVTEAYADRSDDLVEVIDDVDAFLSDVGPQAALHGEALAELRRAAAAFSQHDDRLLDALTELQQLSVAGTDLLRSHRGTLDSTLRSLQRITAEIEARDDDVAQLFGLLTAHNEMTIRGVNAEHIQVIADVILCGFNDEPGDPVRACTAPPQGTERPPPGVPQ